MEQSFKVARAGWNGKGQYAYLARFDKIEPFAMLYNAQRKFVPWLPSQGDLWADDWEQVQ